MSNNLLESEEKGHYECEASLLFSLQEWEVVESPSLPEVHICAGCVELRLLSDRVRELELQLEDIRLVRENEGVIDRRYRQVVTLGPQEAGKWVTVRKGKCQVVESTPVVLPLKNKYSCLSTVGVNSPPGGSSSGRATGA